jgi:hypothetical protein
MSDSIIKKYGIEVLLYRITKGNLLEAETIKDKFRLDEIYKWFGVANYINYKDSEAIKKQRKK